jgi:hypothetical protein
LVPKVCIVDAHRDGQWFVVHANEKADHVFGPGIIDSRSKHQQLSFLRGRTIWIVDAYRRDGSASLCVQMKN